MKQHSTPRSVKQYDVPRTLLIGAVAGAVAAMSANALASCDSEKQTCKDGCYNGYSDLTKACAEERTSRYDDCASIWSQILMTREERNTCRALAYYEGERCIGEAENYRNWCEGECAENWRNCNSG
jgi:hypothetical protein